MASSSMKRQRTRKGKAATDDGVLPTTQTVNKQGILDYS